MYTVDSSHRHQRGSSTIPLQVTIIIKPRQRVPFDQSREEHQNSGVVAQSVILLASHVFDRIYFQDDNVDTPIASCKFLDLRAAEVARVFGTRNIDIAYYRSIWGTGQVSRGERFRIIFDSGWKCLRQLKLLSSLQSSSCSPRTSRYSRTDARKLM